MLRPKGIKKFLRIADWDYSVGSQPLYPGHSHCSDNGSVSGLRYNIRSFCLLPVLSPSSNAVDFISNRDGSMYEKYSNRDITRPGHWSYVPAGIGTLDIARGVTCSTSRMCRSISSIVDL